MTRTKRTDVHRPSAIDPTQYDYVACEYMKIEHVGDVEAVLANRAIIKAHMDRTGGTYSGHQHGGNCHVCGAAAIYTVLFYHADTNSYVRTGGECAGKLECGELERFRSQIKNALKATAGKRKAQALLPQYQCEAAWLIYTATDRTGERREEEIVRGVAGKLVQYGSLSDKQRDLVRRLLGNIKDRAALDALRAAETEAAAPVPVTDKRITISGVIVSRKANDFGVRMLVKTPEGWKVFGTFPRSLEASVGDRVSFAAKVKPSDRDPKFGFFSRPTKAKREEAAP